MTEKDLFLGVLNDVYGEFLGEKQRRVLSAYFDEDLSLSEIAENENITRQGVSDIIKRASKKLYGLEKKCGYAKKFSSLKNLSEDIKNGDKNAINEALLIIDGL